MTPSARPGVPDAKIQLTNGTPLDFALLARLLNAICRDQRTRIPQPDLAAAIGVADRRVEHLSSMAQAFGLQNRRTYTATALGKLVQAHDPFFDDLGTLWFLHYRISSEPRHLVWNRLVTQTLPARRSLTRDQARLAFDDVGLWLTDYSMQSHILKEINAFFDAYTNQHFARLAYLRVQDGAYTLATHQPVPALVLAAAIVAFRDRYRAGDSAVTLSDLLTHPSGPAVVFQLDEGRLRAMLEDLRSRPGFSLESRADLDQVGLTDNRPFHAWLEQYYAER